MIQTAFVRFVLFTAAIAVVRRAASLYFVIDTVGFSTANDHHHHHAAYVTEVNRQQPPRRRCNGRPSQGAAPIAVSLAARSVMCASLCYTGFWHTRKLVRCRGWRSLLPIVEFSVRLPECPTSLHLRWCCREPLSYALCSNISLALLFVHVFLLLCAHPISYVCLCAHPIFLCLLVCTSDFLMFACNALPCGMDSSVILS